MPSLRESATLQEFLRESDVVTHATKILANNDSNDRLQDVCQVLYRRVQDLIKLHDVNNDLCEDIVVSNDDALFSSEAIWGQVECQNKIVDSILKSSVKQLTKAASTKTHGIRLLEDTDDIEQLSVQDEVAKDDDNISDSIEDDGSDEDDDEDNDDEDDEVSRRIQARMERAMHDMESEDEDEEDDNVNTTTEKDAESLEDPAAEELNDGFFNIHEMEDFADEEEDYLPEVAYGEEKPESVKEKSDTRSFHQKQRDGLFDVNNDDDDSVASSDNGLLFRTETDTKRRKYRADDEVEALYNLYSAPVDDDDDDDVEVDPVNMTAIDFYGKPNQKHYDKYYGGDKDKSMDDDDSWDQFDFDQGRKKRKVGWNDSDDAPVNAVTEEVSENDDEEMDAANDDKKEDDNEADEPNDQKLSQSAFAKQQKKLQEQTKILEKDMLAEKPWQMKGEVTSLSRPTNSLLTGTPDFERASKVAPTITVEHTANLEDIIKQRILNESWDDVVPRELPDVGWNKKRGEAPEVSQEQSKLSLGEIYEREYLKKVAGYDVEKAGKESLEDEAKSEIRTLFAKLCSQLDALSNYHFTPRPIADTAEVKVITQPAIAMEEVLPLHVSEARASAPEEVFERKRGRDGILRSESELDQTDRQRMRRSKKAARRQRRKQKEADEKLISRLQPSNGLDNPYEKRKIQQELAEARAKGRITEGKADTNVYGGSNTFFQRMQKQAQTDISSKVSQNDSNGAKSKNSSKSSSFKL